VRRVFVLLSCGLLYAVPKRGSHAVAAVQFHLKECAVLLSGGGGGGLAELAETGAAASVMEPAPG
jgi:hypothetical protein